VWATMGKERGEQSRPTNAKRQLGYAMERRGSAGENWPMAIIGNIFLYNFLKPFYKL
jgi:hypothetical protein